MRLNRNSTKYTLIVAAVVAVIFILVFFVGRKDEPTKPIPVTNEDKTVFSQIDKQHPPTQNYGKDFVAYQVYEAANPPTVHEAKVSRRPLEAKVPYTETFTTSRGIVTHLAVTISKEDPDYVVHVQILGVLYQENEASENNPQAVAFKESFEHLKDWLTSIGVDPYSLYYVFGSQDFDRQVAESWVSYFGLL